MMEQGGRLIGVSAALRDHLPHRVDHERRLLPVDSVPTPFGNDQAAVCAERGLPALGFGPIRGGGHVLPGRQDEQRPVAQRGRRLELGVVGRPIEPFGGLGVNTLPRGLQQYPLRSCLAWHRRPTPQARADQANQTQAASQPILARLCRERSLERLYLGR
jgi:hypothetical protein